MGWNLNFDEEPDCFGKTLITTKLGTALGFVGSAYHILLFQPDTALDAAKRATAATATMAAMGAIFGMTTCLSAQVMGKPVGHTNYFIGGCASGVFLGAKTHSIATGAGGCLSLGLLAWLTKVGKDEGWKLSTWPVE